jgi:hypothetical protein
MATMRDAFICHSEKDFAAAIEIAGGLEAAGFTTWYYERDNVPGESYLIQVGRAIEDSRCVVLLASRHSLASTQVTSEVVRAYESRIPIVPLLLDVTHRDVQERQQVWRQALVTSTSLPIPREGIAGVLPRIVRGMENLGIQPGAPGRIPEPQAGPAHRPSRRFPILAALGAILAAAALTLILLHPWTAPGERLAPVTTPSPPSVAAAPVEPARPSPTVAETPRRAVEKSQARPPVCDLAVLLSGSAGDARTMLARILREQGYRVADPASVDSILAARGSRPTAAELAAAARATMALVGDARTIDVGEAYGLYAVRAEVDLAAVEAASGREAGRWSASRKATAASREAAARRALEGAFEELGPKVRASLPPR